MQEDKREGKQKGLGRVVDWLRGRRPSLDAEPTELDKLRGELEAAREEWAIAQRHIDFVSEPELIDHAIYYLEAAERKYGYLLREAKKRYADGELEPVEPLLQAAE